MPMGVALWNLCFRDWQRLPAEVQLTEEGETLIWFPKGPAVISLPGVGGVGTPDKRVS